MSGYLPAYECVPLLITSLSVISLSAKFKPKIPRDFSKYLLYRFDHFPPNLSEGISNEQKCGLSRANNAINVAN